MARRTTIVYSPHPDDETLYLSGYVSTCAARGDRMILLAATDGDGSGARPAEWSVDDLTRVRRMEQQAAWRALSGGYTEIHRIGLLDGHIADGATSITNFAVALERSYAPNAEHYCACNYRADQSPDHQAVANAVKAANVPVARFALPPGATTGTKYLPPADRLDECQLAWQIYRAFGQLSVKSMFDALADTDYASHIIP